MTDTAPSHISVSQWGMFEAPKPRDAVVFGGAPGGGKSDREILKMLKFVQGLPFKGAPRLGKVVDYAV